MEVYYQGTDITDMVRVNSCIVRDTAGGRCDSLEIEFGNAAGWYSWGPEEDNNVKLVRKGFEEEIRDKNLEVVYTAGCPGWVSEAAVDYVREGLKKHPDVKGIMCGNDDIATQVIRVLSEDHDPHVLQRRQVQRVEDVARRRICRRGSDHGGDHGGSIVRLSVQGSCK